ncbi:sugar MFS transporter [Aestuariibacter sp. A3R04]|uniref:sugar MFS transporter n=1 Tax=Aestuariibacter sp. A3R04 TaxID=2841571 RepID=UPI001C08161D|nr:sugar MFS transporter [Aestuariibacter sp. A3R04]MBU3020527.1 sugar MFS transporter [Aestuariibacter sp. A3R04]
MAAIPGSTPVTSKGNASHFAFAAMTTLFFIWGFITALNDILIPHLKASFSLNYTQAMLVQFCFFGAYFVVSPFAGKLLEKIGYLRGIITGLCTIAAGCAMFYPAAELGIYAIFLLGLFVLAAGVATLQVSANPYVAILGPEKTAASRLNLAQAINSLGHTVGPLFGAALIFSSVAETEVDAKSVQLPYLLLAGVMLITAFTFKFLKLPEITHEETNTVNTKQSVWQHKGLVLGALAIFLYVGAEVSIGSFLVNYFADPRIAGLSQQDASTMVSYYWGGAMVGRFVGAALTRYIKPAYVLAGNAVMAILLLITTTQTTGAVAMWSVIAVGFFNSIMFPTIFSLAIRGLGELTSRGSGLLCQAIVGGAILPMIQGVVADISTVQLSYFVPVLAYVYIGWYALNSSRFARQEQGDNK